MSSFNCGSMRFKVLLTCLLPAIALWTSETLAETVTFERDGFKIEVPTTWRVAKDVAESVSWEFGPAGLPGSVTIFVATHPSTEIAREAMNEALDWTNQLPDEPFWGRRHMTTESLVYTEYARQVAPIPLAPFETHRIISYGAKTLMITSLPFSTTVKSTLDSLQMRDDNGEWHNVVDELLVPLPPDQHANLQIYRTEPVVQEGSNVPTYRYLAIDHEESVAYFVDAVQVPGFGDMLRIPTEFGQSQGFQIPMDEHADTIREWIAGPEAESLIRCELQESRGPYTALTRAGGGTQSHFDCMWIEGELSVAWYVSENGIVVRMFDYEFHPVE